jgi:Fur family ferric uptake transcriptional regulator
MATALRSLSTATHCDLAAGALTHTAGDGNNNPSQFRISIAMKHAKEWARLRDHLAKHGLKVTKQREVILDAFLGMEHVTAEQLYRMLGRHRPHIGLATIYRTLNLLCDSGIAQERHFGSQTHYDNVVNKRHHDHMICTQCGTITEFENCDIERLQEQVAAKHGFTITTHKLELYGLCRHCRH